MSSDKVNPRRPALAADYQRHGSCRKQRTSPLAEVRLQRVRLTHDPKAGRLDKRAEFSGGEEAYVPKVVIESIEPRRRLDQNTPAGTKDSAELGKDVRVVLQTNMVDKLIKHRDPDTFVLERQRRSSRPLTNIGERISLSAELHGSWRRLEADARNAETACAFNQESEPAPHVDHGRRVSLTNNLGKERPVISPATRRVAVVVVSPPCVGISEVGQRATRLVVRRGWQCLLGEHGER